MADMRLRARRSQLLPALHAVQDRIGWISQPALNYISRRLAVPPAEAYGVATFYALYSTKPRPPVVAHVCDDIACRIAGAERICDDLARAVGPAGEAARDGRVGWLRSPCLGLCDLAPAAMITSAGDPDDGHVRSARRRRRDPRAARRRDRQRAAPIPARQAGDPSLRLLRRIGVVDPGSLDDYRASGGFTRPRAGDRDRARGRRRRGHGVQADGSRRCRLPDGPQVGRRRRPARPAPLPRLQRRRVRARHVQGPGAPGG